MRTWFFYGTLLDEDVFRAVTGRALASFNPDPGRALHHRKVFLPGQSYPTLLRSAGKHADGVICRRLPTTVGRDISEYEGPDYVIRRVPVLLDSGTRIAADCFIAKSSPTSAARNWDLESWAASDNRKITLGRIRHMGRP